MARDWVEVKVACALDPGELLGMLDDPAVTGAWEDEGVVRLYWPADRWSAERLDALTALLRRMEPGPANDRISCATVPDRDWNEEWARSVKPIRIGRRIVIRPSWEAVTVRPGEIEVVLDPKQAFGTGHHATTRLLLEWLEGLIHGGERILDVGTGSGILAMAALKLGAASALAVDCDPVAVECAKDYAKVNGFGDELDLRVATLRDLPEPDVRDVTLILANLDRRTLVEAAPLLAPYLERGARLLLSGLLIEDRAEIAAAFEAVGGAVQESREAEGWLALHVIRPESCEGG
ncbi:MAG: 50S ribosomal protein L11 methyltransferase [Nitrospirota bacterium]|nr:50S ribosomal protein L11 methyltransferase [Nitrospirota bacterium]MDE3241668.1 50S ribosomal protein L11 methyltransferase [Nitrospirota bacterium]